jgi:hypothetical protein
MLSPISAARTDLTWCEVSEYVPLIMATAPSWLFNRPSVNYCHRRFIGEGSNSLRRRRRTSRLIKGTVNARAGWLACTSSCHFSCTKSSISVKYCIITRWPPNCQSDHSIALFAPQRSWISHQKTICLLGMCSWTIAGADKGGNCW